MPKEPEHIPIDGDEVTVECWENHRYSPFGGWGPTSSGLDRPAWSTKKGDKVMCRESFLLPVGWSWTSAWNVEPHKDNMEGWYYGADFSISTKYCSSKQSKFSMVRRRRWVRTRKNCQAELEFVASVRGSAPRASLLSQASSTFTVIPEPKVFVPEFCFRYTTWTNTASYGFSGANEKALAAEQDRYHNSFIRLHKLLASTEFFDNHTGTSGHGDLSAAASNGGGGPPKSPEGGQAFFGADTPVSPNTDRSAQQNFNGDYGSAASPNGASIRSNTNGAASPTTAGTMGSGGAAAERSVSGKILPISTTVPERTLQTVYKYGVAPVLRRHLWVAWSGAGAKKSANAGLFHRLAKEAAVIMEKGHRDGTNEMLAEILQDVVRTAPRHPFFEHSQVLSLMKTKKSLANNVTPTSGGGAGGPNTACNSQQDRNRGELSRSLSSPSSPHSPAEGGYSSPNESSPMLRDGSTDGGGFAPTTDSFPNNNSSLTHRSTTVSGVIANNNVGNHSGGFINDNSGSYRLTLTLVCLSLYEKEQAAYRKSIEEGLAAAASAAAALGAATDGTPTGEASTQLSATAAVAATSFASGSATSIASVPIDAALSSGSTKKAAPPPLHAAVPNSTAAAGAGVTTAANSAGMTPTSSSANQQQQPANHAFPHQLPSYHPTTAATFKKVPEYHQAFSYMAALLLLNMPEEEAFWTLVCLLEDFLPNGYHDDFKMHTDLRVLNEIIREKLPQLDANFSRHQVDMSVFASGWLQGLFCAHFPFATAARILDVLFAEGNSSILVRAIFAFMKLHKGFFLTEDSSCGAGQYANNWARECFVDMDEVLHMVANDQRSSDMMSVVEHRRRELYSMGQ